MQNIVFNHDENTISGALGVDDNEMEEVHSFLRNSKGIETVSVAVETVIEHPTFTDGQKVYALLQIGGSKGRRDAMIHSMLEGISRGTS